MYAVIETGGKQYRVELGTELAVELLDVEPGQDITLDRVLLVADGDRAAVGRPLVTDAAVSAEVLRQDRGKKVVVFKYRPKARSRVKKGHRQEQTVLRITDVRFDGRSAAQEAARQEEAVKTERQRLEEAAARQAAEDAALAAKLAARTPARTVEGEEEAAVPRRSRAGRAAARPAAPEKPATPEKPARPEPPETAEPAEEAPAAKPASRRRAARAAPASQETVGHAEPETAAEPEPPSAADESPSPAPKRRRAKKDE